ncbi:CD3324 family protein [Clostridium sp. YIM B02506]|uniref:CD3324 family protein n=1 Tax=Clostridium sp. YIM B02506 TaxID=2910680 RepID=UPI001EEF08B8|nr:CD3324 family protein [Clostridium sp. YIM B02506]
MKYINASEVLPKHLLMEIQRHVNGKILYIPSCEEHSAWGEKNGSKSYFENRNKEIRNLYKLGCNIEELSKKYGLAYDTIRKIVYKKLD